MKDNIYPKLVQALFDLLQAHQDIFRQKRTFMRAMGLVISEVFVFARHTVTQELLALGLTDEDWSAWYRLFSLGRFDADKAARCFFKQTLPWVEPSDVYVIGVDGVQVPRSSLKMPGTSWLKAPRTAAWKAGIHRAQRFLNLSWLVPLVEGYSRAIPLQWLPAFPAKAIPTAKGAQKEWEAGLKAIVWVRDQLDAAGRAAQLLLAVADGNFEKAVEFWE